MAADNLSIEVQKQKESEAVSKQRLLLLLKVVYRVHRDGIVRFAMSGKDLGTMVKRARVLYRTLRANSGVAEQMQARSRRLAESETRLTEARQSMVQLENELREQEGLLGTFLDQKKTRSSPATSRSGALQRFERSVPGRARRSESAI